MDTPPFIPQRFSHKKEPWLAFGARNREDYEIWSKEVCGICCLKMIGDSWELTTYRSIYSLTIDCLNSGGFTITSDGVIHGVFHKHLLHLAQENHMDGQVVKHLDMKTIIRALSESSYVILSVNTAKLKPCFPDNHMVLVYACSPHGQILHLHDPGRILSKTGKNIQLSRKQLERISNNKGLIIQNKRKNLFSFFSHGLR